MDLVLQNHVENLVETTYQKVKAVDNYNYLTPLNKVMKNAKILHVLQKKYVEFDFDLTTVKQELKEFVNDLVYLAAALKIKQDKNISFTNKALTESNTDLYLQEKQNESIGIDIENPNQKTAIENLIAQTEKRYTEKFGEFTDYKTANTIINKEFEETKEFLPDLEKIKDLPYKHIDNFSRLISSMTDMATEALQLSAVLVRAERYLNHYNTHKQNYKPLYFILDGIDSTKALEKNPNYYEDLKQKTNKLNIAIQKNEQLSLLCNFVAYKQDEVHGVINGDVETFVQIAKEIFKGIHLRAVYSDKKITNIEKTIYGNPYELYGPACIDCRKKITANKHHFALIDGNAIYNNKTDSQDLSF